MITLKHDKVSKVINVPTSVNEITSDVLTKLAENITIAKHRAVVALCWKVSFADMLFDVKSKNKSAQVTPLLAKINAGEDYQKEIEYLKVGKKLILTRSAIEMGVHVHVPNGASLNSIASWIKEVEEAEGATNKFVKSAIVPKGDFILIEFKVINIGDINGVIESDTLNDDPFIVK